MPISRRIRALVFVGFVALLAASHLLAQGDRRAPKKSSVPPYALIFGNVFDPAGQCYAGASVEVRRDSERKARWRTQSDARGEFGVRLPAGAGRYVLTLRARGFAEEVRTVTIADDERVDLLFHLQPLAGGKR